MKDLNEEEGACTSGTQPSDIGNNKISIFGSDAGNKLKIKDSNDFYKHLLEMDDYKEGSNEYTILFNRGALERRQVPNEEETITGSRSDLMEFLDSIGVDCVVDYDENDQDFITTFDKWLEIYEAEADYSGSTVVLKITENGETIYENSDIEEFRDEELDESKLLEKENFDYTDKLNALIAYLNKNTSYEWDSNDIYDNCAITESDEDYIEVFITRDQNNNFIYTVDNYSYNTMEELVKNMPVLYDGDKDTDYDEGWEDEEDEVIDKKEEAKTEIPSDFLKRDYEKLKKDPMVSAKEHWSDAYYQEVLDYSKELTEATVLALQGKLLENNEEQEKLFLKQLIDNINKNTDYEYYKIKGYSDMWLNIRPKDKKFSSEVTSRFHHDHVDPNTHDIIFWLETGVYDFNLSKYFIKDWFREVKVPIEKCSDETILRQQVERVTSFITKALDRAVLYKQDHPSKPLEPLVWKTMSTSKEDSSEDCLILQSKRNGYWFNIYKIAEENTYEVTVNYCKGEEDIELQDLDKDFETIEDAKAYCEKIYKDNPGSDYRY